MGVLCLLFFGLFQLSQVAAAREILHHAAARGARCKTVGFNRFMVRKSIRVAAIPNAGHMTEPGFDGSNTALRDMVETMRPGELWDAGLSDVEIPTTRQDLELARIPEFMASENWARARYILDYEDWDAIRDTVPTFVPDGTIMEIRVAQDYPLRIPLHRTIYAPHPNADGVDTVLMHGISSIEGHYPLYLNDQDW